MSESQQITKIRTEKVNLFYGDFHALKNISMEIPEKAITAIIGPSGCGKSSLLRIFNRMNDLILNARVEGEVFLDGEALYGGDMDAVGLRKRVGMVFQKPNPFPMSIYDNIIFGPRHNGIKGKQELRAIVERSLTQVDLWRHVKDDLKKSGQDLPAEQQQRLCIARTLAMEPEVILMDESCSALDPEATTRVEELMLDLAKKYTIITVTHSMEQAVRISNMSAFMCLDEERIGTLIEFSTTQKMFSNPKHMQTEDYITGRFG